MTADPIERAAARQPYRACSLDTLDAALSYCARGWRVLPVWPVGSAWTRPVGAAFVCLCREGRACAWPGKHPACSGGAADATADAARVAAFWGAFRARYHCDPSVGVATGHGLVVVDVDRRHLGHETWSRLLEGRAARPDTVTALTPGGVHLYFSAASSVPSSVGRLGPGVDVRGRGGFVVAPPSSHASGRAYGWEASSDPDDGAEVAALPSWLLSLCLLPAEGDSRGASLRAGLAPGSVGAGARNDTLARVACSLRGRGLDMEELTEELRRINADACAEPLSPREVWQIARGVVRRYRPGWSPAVQARIAASEDAYQRAAAAEGDYPWKADPAAILAGLHAPVPADPGGPDV